MASKKSHEPHSDSPKGEKKNKGRNFVKKVNLVIPRKGFDYYGFLLSNFTQYERMEFGLF